MKSEYILDDNFSNNENRVYFEALKWWESKRWIFNLILISTQLTMLYYNWERIEWQFGIQDSMFYFIAFTIVGNILFCVGWGLEFITKFYFGKNKFLIYFRPFIFFMGILFTLLLTLWMYSLYEDNMLYYSF